MNSLNGSNVNLETKICHIENGCYMAEITSKNFKKYIDQNFNKSNCSFYFCSSTLRRAQQTLYYFQKELIENNHNNLNNYHIFPCLSEVNEEDINTYLYFKILDDFQKNYTDDNPWNNTRDKLLFQKLSKVKTNYPLNIIRIVDLVSDKNLQNLIKQYTNTNFNNLKFYDLDYNPNPRNKTYQPNWNFWYEHYLCIDKSILLLNNISLFIQLL